MCPPATHRILTNFIDSLPPSSPVLESHLVIAGDIVDFLAERPFTAFTGDPDQACEKLQRIFDSTSVFWDALSRFAVERDGVLSLMLGNHDIELSLPGVRQMLLERIGGHRTTFIYDNEAFTLGPLLVEHGNRFDAWNAVPHGALRRVRSQLSRKLPVVPDFPALPGSRMVIDVINPLKLEYPFVDLLKPETAVALPIAAALGGVGLKEIWKAFGKFRDTNSVDYDEAGGEPIHQNYISGAANTDQPLWDVAQSIAAGANMAQVGGLANTLRGVGATARAGLRTARIEALFTAFRKLADLRRMHREAFAMEIESNTYLKPALRSAAAGFKAIVYGHTHLPKRVTLAPDVGDAAIYLNTGTWADVMCIPHGIWDPDEAAGRTLFRRFCDDLDTEALAGWRRSMPTYARIEVDGDQLLSAQLHFADDDSLATTEGVWKRLLREPVA
jgi:UDP-2,3-diacylglucosamine pyrophosphatase LpxH